MAHLGGRHSSDKPATPGTHVAIQPKHDHVIRCAIGFKNPIDLATLKDELANSIMLKIPRFTSLLIVDPHSHEAVHWKKTQVNLDDHIFIHHHDDDHDDEISMSDEDAINSYLADIAISPPMSYDKPLWEIHIMHEHRCMVLRVHHAVADGVSLMSLLWTMGKSSPIERVHDDYHHHHHDHVCKKRRSFQMMGCLRDLWQKLMHIWFSLIFVLKFIARCLWVKDTKTVISGIEGVKLWPRKVATARFKISDMKTIKKVLPNAVRLDLIYLFDDIIIS